MLLSELARMVWQHGKDECSSIGEQIVTGHGLPEFLSDEGREGVRQLQQSNKPAISTLLALVHRWTHAGNAAQ